MNDRKLCQSTYCFVAGCVVSTSPAHPEGVTAALGTLLQRYLDCITIHVGDAIRGFHLDSTYTVHWTSDRLFDISSTIGKRPRGAGRPVFNRIPLVGRKTVGSRQLQASVVMRCAANLGFSNRNSRRRPLWLEPLESRILRGRGFHKSFFER